MESKGILVIVSSGTLVVVWNLAFQLLLLPPLTVALVKLRLLMLQADSLRFNKSVVNSLLLLQILGQVFLPVAFTVFIDENCMR